jgi:hypothetical protein
LNKNVNYKLKIFEPVFTLEAMMIALVEAGGGGRLLLGR